MMRCESVRERESDRGRGGDVRFLFSVENQNCGREPGLEGRWHMKVCVKASSLCVSAPLLEDRLEDAKSTDYHGTHERVDIGFKIDADFLRHTSLK